jgi:HK97 family phage major capsid protein
LEGKLNEQEFDKYVDEKVGQAVVAKVAEMVGNESEAFKSQIKEQLAEKLKEFKPAPSAEEEAVEKAKKEKKFKSFGEMLTSIFTARHFGILDPRLVYLDSDGKISKPVLTPTEKLIQIKALQESGKIEKVMTEGVDSAGGFLVEEQFIPEVRQLFLEKSVVRPNGATIFPMTSDTLRLPRIDDTSHASNVFGGVVAYRTEEAGTKTPTDIKWGECKLTAHELSGYTVASNSLLADAAIPLEIFLKKRFSEAWAYFDDDDFINGNGVGRPLGILSSGALIAVARQANNAVRWVDICNMAGRLLTGSWGNAIWLINQEVLTQLLRMVAENAAPAATAGHVIWVNPNQGAANQIPGTILGRPYFITEKMQALGTQGDIGLFDLSYYFIGDRQTITIDASTHVYFINNKTCWRFVIRDDGQPWLQSPLTPRHGTNTVSPFVVLSSTS